MDKKYIFERAKTNISSAERMLIFSLILNEKKIFLKIYNKIYEAAKDLTSIISKDKNIKNKLKGCLDKEQIDKIIEILEIKKRIESSEMEFVKKGKLVFLLSDLKTPTIDSNNLREYLEVLKILINKLNLD